MSIKCNIKIIRKVFNRDDFYIWGAVPTSTCRDIELNKYGNFTLIGELGYLEEGTEYKNAELVEAKETLMECLTS